MENAEIMKILDGLDLSNVQCPLSKVQSTNFMKVHAFFKIERLMLVMIVDDSVHVVHYSVNVVDDDCILFVSSEGALYVILPYDYPAAAHPLFEHTPVLNNNFDH